MSLIDKEKNNKQLQEEFEAKLSNISEADKDNSEIPLSSDECGGALMETIVGVDTYTDPQTGLMWVTNGNIAGKKKTWEGAMNWVKDLKYGGYSDWRLPTIDELVSFAKRGENRPDDWFNFNGFNSVTTDYYWSGSTRGKTSLIWVIRICDGSVRYYGKNNNGFYVWPVRSVQIEVADEALAISATVDRLPR